MSQPVGVVINPAAAGGRARGVGERVLAHLRGRGLRVENLSQPTAELALKRAKDAADRIRALIVVGGDGVVHLGVNALAETGVPLGIVACGSGNDLARALELPVGQPARAVGVVVNGIDGAARAIDGMRVSHGLGQEWALGVVSVGIDAAVNARANTYRWPGEPHGTCARWWGSWGAFGRMDTAWSSTAWLALSPGRWLRWRTPR